MVSTGIPTKVKSDLYGHAENYLAHDRIRDGREVTLRAIRPGDKPLLQEGMHHLTERSLYFRFFTFKKELSDSELAYFTEMDFERHVGLLAILTIDGEERPVGVGRYIVPAKADRADSAEVAFAVDEEFQGLGVATILLKHLSRIAKSKGINRFFGFVHSENEKMLEVFRNCGLPMEKKFNEVSVCEVSLDLG